MSPIECNRDPATSDRLLATSYRLALGAFMRLLIALFAAVLMTACATNPVTGKREISFMSEEQEINPGRELDAQVRQEMGVYRG